MKKSFAESARDFVAEWSVTILILLFGTTTLMQAFVVPTSSMERTVLVGDHMIVDKLSYSPPGPIGSHILPYTPVKRGDIIVFRWPVDPRQNYVKRVMGVPGDHLRVVNKEVFLNGHKLTEPYTQHIFPQIEAYRDNFPAEPFGPVSERGLEMLAHNVVNGEVVVPPEHYFAMGDNRDNSLDSRYWGFVPRADIVGRPLFVYWSFIEPDDQYEKTGVGDRVQFYLHVITHFFDQTRWRRTLHVIR
jgi:signal peptidase I